MFKKIFALAVMCSLVASTALAEQPSTTSYPAYIPTSITINADKQNTIHIINNSKQAVSLNLAQVQFYYNGAISGLSLDKAQFSLIKHIASPQSPNSMGGLYIYQLKADKSLVLKPQSKLAISVNGKSLNNEPIHGVTLQTQTLVPVQAQFTVTTTQGNTTVSICNNSPYSIPLTSLELDFNYGGNAISTIWGAPWLDWQSTNNGNQFAFIGGNTYTSAYAPDPQCKNSITVIFNAAQGVPDPNNFVLKAAGGTPIGYGTLDVAIGNAPQAGLTNPTITIDGMGTHEQQSVAWGKDWVLPSLVPGTYTIQASSIDNGTSYYQATVMPNSANVINKQTTTVNVNYQTVPTGQVAVTLSNAPGTSEPVLFSGTKDSYQKTVTTNSTVTLPQDTYVISSTVPGYATLISPSSINLTQSASVNITYNQIKDKNYVGYFETWEDNWADTPQQTQLAKVPTYVNYVMLSFMKPDAQYTAGSLNFSDTGLQFGYDGQMLKQAIQALRQANPNVKILVSVGGATYPNWGALNPQAIADFVKDFGLDGVDVDYEIDPGCVVTPGQPVKCSVDQQYSQVVSDLRKVLPRPYLLTIAGWSTGAYGEGQWTNAQPGGSHTGSSLPLFRTNSQDIDMVNVMSYDAGSVSTTGFDPLQALAAYQYYFKGPIAMGVEVPPEAWGGHVYTLSAVSDLTNAVLQSAAATGNPPGMMIWALQINATGTPSANNPSAEMMSKQICQQLGLGNCDQTWPF